VSLAEKKESIIKALRLIHERIGHHEIIWIIIGSSSLWLQEVDIVPEDIDILATKEGAFKIGKLLQDFEKRPIDYSRSGRYESYIGQYEINGVLVEIMGDLRILIDNTWVPYSDRLSRRVFVEIEGLRFPVSSLEDHLASYQKMKREGDEEKVRKIKEALGENIA
jgi:predicted nucleotidyltransferase